MHLKKSNGSRILRKLSVITILSLLAFFFSPAANTGDSKPKPIKSVKIENGAWIVNGKEVRLKGASNRDAWIAGSGILVRGRYVPHYKYSKYKKTLLNADWTTENGFIPYVRHMVPKGKLDWTEKEIREFLDSGFVVMIELFDAGYTDNPDQEPDWKKVVDRFIEYPVVFEANNEFIGDPEKKSWTIDKVIEIIKYVKDKGGYITAGAWSGGGGKKMSDEFHKRCNLQDMESHHRGWDLAGINHTLSFGKGCDANELHTRDINYDETVRLFTNFFKWGALSVNVYPLSLYESKKDERWNEFYKIVDFVAQYK